MQSQGKRFGLADAMNERLNTFVLQKQEKSSFEKVLKYKKYKFYNLNDEAYYHAQFIANTYTCGMIYICNPTTGVVLEQICIQKKDPAKSGVLKNITRLNFSDGSESTPPNQTSPAVPAWMVQAQPL